MAQKNSFGVERIKIVRGEHSRMINRETFLKQKDRKGWYEEIPLPIQQKNEFVPPEVANMKNKANEDWTKADPATFDPTAQPKGKPGRPSKESINDPNKS